MKKHINTAAAAVVLALAILSLGACASGDRTGTHEMGAPSHSSHMSNSVMTPPAAR